MQITVRLIATVTLFFSGMALAHVGEEAHHGLMGMHWHLGPSGAALGLPASIFGLGLLAAAVLGIGIAYLLWRSQKRRYLMFMAAGGSAAMSIVGAFLLTGVV